MARRRRQKSKRSQRAAAFTARTYVPAPKSRAIILRSPPSRLKPAPLQFTRNRLDQGASPSRFIPAKRSVLVDRPRQVQKHSHGPQQTRFCNHKRNRDKPTPTSAAGLARIRWMAIKC